MGEPVTCPCCGCESPPGRHCIRCGSELARARRRYGASPNERAGLPYLVSTLFPALPRAEMWAFRGVLAGGAALVAVLTLAGLFPLALTAAALLVPILSALYLWDVDVYEDQPWRVVGLTVVTGVVAGFLLGRASDTFLGEDALTTGVLLPLAQLALALAGPIALLLPRERFNDLLDGATFGAVGAAALTATVALTRAASLLRDGVRPGGDEGEWLLRLAGLGIGMPVLAMCAAGGAAASLWVRFRAPVPDDCSLGPLARPRYALPLAGALMVAAALAQIALPGAVWLVVLLLLDAAALLWLRKVIHEGLRQQSLENEPGPEEACKECGVATPVHTYCANCGTARAALPKGRGHGRLVLVAIPAAALALGLGAATARGLTADPGAADPPCVRGEACGRPPEPPAPLTAEREVGGGELGWTGVYDAEVFALDGEPSDGGYDLRMADASRSSLRVRVRVRRGGTPRAALRAERERLAEDVLGLADDTDPHHRVAGPMIGYRAAEVAVLSATGGDTPQGPSRGFTAVVLAASEGGLTATVTLTATEPNAGRRRAVMGAADLVLQGFRWGADGPVTASLVLKPRRARALLASSAGRGPRLSAEQIGRRFGPSDAALDRVRAAVRAAGLRPLPVAPQRTSMPVRGPAAAVERLFGVRLLAARGGRHRPDRPGRVPAVLRPHVAAVGGLDTRALARPAAFPAGGLRPVDARRVYAMDDRRLGEGETVAVLSLDTFDPADVAEYDRITGTDAPPVERVPVNGGTRLGSGREEVNLDLDVIRGLVPRARLLNYEARNTASAFAEVMERIVADGDADVVSISWGRCELHVEPGDRAADEAAFRAAAAAGIAVFVASGDYGAYECERFDSDDQRLSVSWPAASRHVVAVGGTTLRLDDQRRRAAEYGWEGPLSNHGAGGGVAASEPQPPWQADGAVPGLRNEHSTGRRQVPDVAAAADFRTGWLMVVDGEPKHVGGTSAAAPFWAAVAVTLRESLRRAGRPPPASVPRLLYDVAATPGSRAFNDVVAGGNRFHDAGPGWDYATGLGTPNVGRLLEVATNLGTR